MSVPRNILSRAHQCGRRRNSKDLDQLANWLILVRQFSRLENGPNERSPSKSIAYQPGLMPRMPDWSSLM
jgi:hypothetical protein